MRAVDLLGPGGPFSRGLEGYEERSAQLEMAELVERALAAEGVALVEAGTGTGKTLAYLVPAILSGKKVVISTGTKTLQDQIMQRDLPLLERHLGLPVSAACLKGLGNYLCLRRYQEFVHSPEADRSHNARYLPLLREFRATTESGERSELSGVPEDASLWGEVQSGADTRIGQRCSHYEACFVTRMRRAAEAAQIVVVNHHLFFADLALRSAHGGVLPNFDAVIFDEAHQIEDVVTEFFGVRVSTTRVSVLARDAERAFRAARRFHVAEPLLSGVVASASAFFASLPSGHGAEVGKQPLSPGTLAGRVREPMLQFDTALEALASQAQLDAHESEAIAHVGKRVQRLRDEIAQIVDGRNAAQVLWTDARGKSTSLGASPVDVGDILRERLFGTSRSVILTSATLTTGGSFSFIRERLGIDFEVEELSLPSPFDFSAQAALYLPQALPEPRDPEFVAAAAREILALIQITGGGAFVLCTSLRMMQQLHAVCGLSLHPKPLVQGMAPKTELLATFKARANGVLFASASFWEGVDVPGDALRLVIIDKLPFEVPSDPLVRARCERMDERGESAFMKYLVPNAALTLKQGFGRLIRTRADRGVVAVLDRRLTSKGYGRVFLKSLPDASRCSSLDEVHAFWERDDAQATRTLTSRSDAQERAEIPVR